MPSLELRLDGDGCWPDLAAFAHTGKLLHMANDAPPIQVALLRGGMQSGAPSLSLRFDMPNGQVLVAQVSWRLWLHTTRILYETLGESL